ncbi:hypothetical protein [Solibacillus isronensis]|uniref:hypothetical protein n=1 Tax=Solibacillus isronensis TaxID=412383 RepID=UPI00203B7E9A|nr:hypothetical protein [Solibacillus isronensis]MCM3722145.1 hypothetical protein [Solibacillus isronensis]
MIALLKMHFYLSRKLFITVFLFIVGMIAILWIILKEINFGFMVFYFMLLSPSLGMSYLIENHFIKRFRVMPIDPRDFVKSLFVFSLLLLLIITIPIGIYQTYLYLDNQIGPIELSLLSIAFAAGIASVGSMVKNYLSNPTKGTKSISIGTMLGYFFIFTLVHLLILFIFSIMNIELMGAPIVSIIGFIIYYQYYKSAAIKFQAAEF